MFAGNQITYKGVLKQWNVWRGSGLKFEPKAVREYRTLISFITLRFLIIL